MKEKEISRDAFQEHLANFKIEQSVNKGKRRRRTVQAAMKKEEVKRKIISTKAKHAAQEMVKEIYTPFKEQAKIHKALRPMNTGKIVMAICGRRFGKTTVAVNEVIDHAVEVPGSRIWYIAHTEKQAYRIAWVEMLNWRLDKRGNRKMPYLPEGLIEKKREDQHVVLLKNGSRIEFLGTVKELPMLGAGLNFVVFDEFPGIPWSVWFDIVRPMLIDYRGNALFIGTVPDPVKHDISIDFIEMYEDILYGRAAKKHKAFNFDSFCNPHINKQEIEEQINDLKRKGRENDARRLYYGKYTREYGVVFPRFKYKQHTMEPMELPGNWIRVMALDPHPVKPAIALWCAISPNNHFYFYREMEFSVDGHTLPVPEMVYDINEVENKYKESITTRLIDPTYAKVDQQAVGSKNVKELFQDYGLWFDVADRRDDVFFHRLTDMLVDEPEPTFHIFRSCPGLIRQIQNATWESWGSAKARAERGPKDKIKRGDDDYRHCAKYIINSNIRDYGMRDKLSEYRHNLNQRWHKQREMFR